MSDFWRIYNSALEVTRALFASAAGWDGGKRVSGQQSSQQQAPGLLCPQPGWNSQNLAAQSHGSESASALPAQGSSGFLWLLIFE